MVPDGLSKIPKPSRIKASESKFENLEFRFLFIPIWPEVPRRFPEVLRKDMEGFQACKFRFREPFGGLVDGRSYLCITVAFQETFQYLALIFFIIMHKCVYPNMTHTYITILL